MSYDQVKDRTSSTVGTEEDGGVLFDETIAAYSQRRKRTQEFLSEALVESHRKAFRAYLQRPQWTTVADDSSAGTRLSNPTLDVIPTCVLIGISLQMTHTTQAPSHPSSTSR